MYDISICNECMVLSEETCKKCSNRIKIDKLKNTIAIWEESVKALRKGNFLNAMAIRQEQLEGYKKQLKELEGIE